MKRLGYTRYVAQGGDWGNALTEQMALLAPPELLGIHTNMPATVPDDVAEALKLDELAPANLSADEKHAFDQLAQDLATPLRGTPGISDSWVGTNCSGRFSWFSCESGATSRHGPTLRNPR
jgi:hypothetical protein